jgi:hypothetical protein
MMSNQGERNFDLGKDDSPQEKLSIESGFNTKGGSVDTGKDEGMEEVDVVIKKHIRRHSGSFSTELNNIGEVSHPNFERFVRDNRRPTPEMEAVPSVEDIALLDEERNMRQCSKGNLMLLVHIIFSTIMVVFCIYQLSLPTITPDLRTLYSTMLTGTIALYSPSPFQSKKNAS